LDGQGYRLLLLTILLSLVEVGVEALKVKLEEVVVVLVVI
jgi:hypothetical protein